MSIILLFPNISINAFVKTKWHQCYYDVTTVLSCHVTQIAVHWFVQYTVRHQVGSRFLSRRHSPLMVGQRTCIACGAFAYFMHDLHKDALFGTFDHVHRLYDIRFITNMLFDMQQCSRLRWGWVRRGTPHWESVGMRRGFAPISITLTIFLHSPPPPPKKKKKKKKRRTTLRWCNPTLKVSWYTPRFVHLELSRRTFSLHI